MFLWHGEKNLLDFFLLCGQRYRRPKEPFLEVTNKLHLAMHVIMHGNERRLLSGAKPIDQLVTNVWEPGEHLKVTSLTFDKVFEHLGVFV